MIHNERIWGDTSPYFCYGIWQVLFDLYVSMSNGIRDLGIW
jgi:hypothetical protein